MNVRVDRNDIPTLVQNWRYREARSFEIELCDGRYWLLDMDAVREESCRGYERWSAETDQMAIDEFVNKHMALFYPCAC